MRKQFIAFPVFFFLVLLSAQAWSLETIRFGVSFKGNPGFELANWAALEKGFWREQGLEVKWYGFRGATDFFRAVAAQALDMGIANVESVIPARARGVPMLVVAQYPTLPEFSFWVMRESPLKKGEELKGKKIGVPRAGGTAHVQGIFALRKLGLEDKVKFVSVGGLAEQIATLKAGVVETTVVSFLPMAELAARGEVRSLVNVRDFLPKDWVGAVVVAWEKYAQEKGALAKRTTTALSQAVEFIRGNELWAREKLVTELHFSPEAAKLVALALYPGQMGRINKRGLENVISFLSEFNLLPGGKVPSMESLVSPAEALQR